MCVKTGSIPVHRRTKRSGVHSGEPQARAPGMAVRLENRRVMQGLEE